MLRIMKMFTADGQQRDKILNGAMERLTQINTAVNMSTPAISETSFNFMLYLSRVIGFFKGDRDAEHAES